MAEPTKDPLVTAWFGIDFQGQIAGAFRECTGFGSENEVVEAKGALAGKLTINKVPGRLKWNNITLKRGITDSMDMWKWRQMVEQGDIIGARKNGTVTMFNAKGEAVAKWDFVNAWPNKLNGPSANATSNEVGIEELELVHEGYTRTQ